MNINHNVIMPPSMKRGHIALHMSVGNRFVSDQ